MRIPLTLMVLLALSCSVCTAVEGPSPALGKPLFEATTLGSNGNSCATCHPGGNGLNEVHAYDDSMLREMINFCIRDALNGTMLALESQEIEALQRYVRSLITP